jgi:tape measure domain-containing protein
MNDLSQFSEVIPNAFQIVADELGLTVDELRKRIKDGTLNVKEK